MAIAPSNSSATTSEASVDKNLSAAPIEAPNSPFVLQSDRSPTGSRLFQILSKCVWLALHSRDETVPSGTQLLPPGNDQSCTASRSRLLPVRVAGVLANAACSTAAHDSVRSRGSSVEVRLWCRDQRVLGYVTGKRRVERVPARDDGAVSWQMETRRWCRWYLERVPDFRAQLYRVRGAP